VLLLTCIGTVSRHQLSTPNERTAAFDEIDRSREWPLCQRERSLIMCFERNPDIGTIGALIDAPTNAPKWA
jgi:hypothetical protein